SRGVLQWGDQARDPAVNASCAQDRAGPEQDAEEHYGRPIDAAAKGLPVQAAANDRNEDRQQRNDSDIDPDELLKDEPGDEDAKRRRSHAFLAGERAERALLRLPDRAAGAGSRAPVEGKD